MANKKHKLVVRNILISRDKITNQQNNSPIVLNEEEKEFFEERAAIIEFDAGISREQAEVEARKNTSDFFHHSL